MDDYLTNLLGALALAVSDVQDQALETQSRPRADLEALLAVYARPGSTVRDIALTTELTHSGAVRVIDRLGALGWVERRAGEDRRTVELHCTKSGSEKARSTLALRRQALRDLAETLSPAQATSFRKAAERILSSLPKDRPDAWRICRLCDHGVCDAPTCPVGGAVS